MRIARWRVGGCLLLAAGSLAAQSVKCEANISGFKIHKVYVIGDQFEGLKWAYHHLSEFTCLTPTLRPEGADAILEVRRGRNIAKARAVEAASAPVTVSCSSGSGSTLCEDSLGNEMSISCNVSGECSSYYGPNPLHAVGEAMTDWLETRWYESEASLFTPDRKLIWNSEDQKGEHWTDLWPDKLREGTNSPACKMPRSGSFDLHRYRTYRAWGEHHCGIIFDPAVDIEVQRKVSNDPGKQRQMEMKTNAEQAAQKQAAGQRQ